MVDIDDKKFSKEVRCLMLAKHRNIVRFLGYCSDTQGEMMNYEGELVLADVRQRLLCFEYLSQGSLDKQITDTSHGLEWRKCYEIISGICDGLCYLHQKRIVHLDLKPANILLDDNMMPKIADFGLSRCFKENQSRIITLKLIGTLGYMPPEFYGGQITFKFDIYSLGIIIIEILTGEKGYPNIDKVLGRWRNKLEKTQGDTQLVQVRVCTEIAIECIDSDPAKRPDIQHIVNRLGETRSEVKSATETGASSSSSVPQLAALPPDPTIGQLYNRTNQNHRFSSMLDNTSIVQQVTDRRETASDVEEALIIGRNEEKQKIVATLSGSITPEMTVLPIYGIGGIGKTTLAQIVFNASQFAGYSRVWVYVSQNLDLNKIGNSILSQLSEESHVAEKQMIHNKLRKVLAGKKILVVLDDVWEKNPDTLKSLKAMLRLGVGSMVTIIVTTRDEAIAREICHTVEPYKLGTLTDKFCWKIIKEKTSFKDRVDKKQMKHTGREIATKCGGVALAAQSLGYTLNGKSSDEWESVRDNYIWNLSTTDDPSSRNHEVLASLLLSYHHMPECLKLCFTYCAVFPKGHNIVKYDLIHQWIALKFIEQCSIFDSMQLCEKYVTQLLGMSFLQYSKTPLSDGQKDKAVTLFTMHDLVHDLARAILADQVNDKGSTGGNRCRYALLTDCSKPLQSSVTCPANINALHFLGCGKLKLCGDAFSLATCLHVLDLSGCLIQKLPDSVSQLKQLRFLCAPKIQAKMIPSCITELSELNYLNLRDSYFSALPDSIGAMKGLMHLDLSRCEKINELPVSFTELKQLVHLDLSYCQVSVSEAFGGFTKLQYLNLSSPFIKDANRRGLSKVIGNLIKLRYLNLSGCVHLMAPSEYHIGIFLDSISTLSNLEHLDLSLNKVLFSIPESIGNLRKLHTLNLSCCYNLKKLPDSMVKMVSLKVVDVASCSKLDESALSRLNVASLPDFVVHASSDKCSSNITLLQHTNPDRLMIDRLENVMSPEEAKSIKLIEKQKISKLSFQWTRGAEMVVDEKEVLEKLVPPISVLTLSIKCYSSVSFPDWLMGMRQYLPNLCRLYLYDFPNCNKLPPLGKLPNLRSLIIDRMEGLEEWNTEYTSGDEGADELMFPKLRTLTIKQCLKLRIKPCLPRAIISLEIIDCDNMLSSKGESPSHLSHLSVYDSVVPMHEWRLLHDLPALRKLSIDNCSDLTTSSEIIQHLSSLESLCLHSLSLDQAELPSWLVELTSLHELSLFKYRSMTSLPHSLGELTSLEKLKIEHCERIKSLPDSIQKLTKLYILEIVGCPTLRKWCVSKENKMKIAHINKKLLPKTCMGGGLALHG
ncbi:disease resistance protein RGA2-like isoform X2 [Triticum urartu]|nr:disease resistance protein RGA2-like isoform X2 [Triticum urartu]XP_048527348.1 disease resistance protein RGA2-like isoform X2 [Triticum urartu]